MSYREGLPSWWLTEYSSGMVRDGWIQWINYEVDILCLGLVCIEGDFWKDQRSLTTKWLRELGVMKYGPKRETMQNRIMDGVNLCIAELEKSSSKDINPLHLLNNTVGNVVNDFVFGVTYDWDDETWKYLQYLQEEGVKLVGVSAGANFLPVLRWALKYCINSTHNMSRLHIRTFHPALLDFSPTIVKTWTFS